MAMPAMAAKLTYQIKGVRGEQKDNVEAYLNALPVYQERQYRPARAKITESVQKALQVYGYYQPKITLNRDKKAPAKVVIEIERGEPVIISRLDILLEGDAGSDEVYSELLDKLPLKEEIPSTTANMNPSRRISAVWGWPAAILTPRSARARSRFSRNRARRRSTSCFALARVTISARSAMTRRRRHCT